MLKDIILKKSLIIGSIAIIFFGFCLSSIPFFWDVIHDSLVANFFYDNNFNTLNIPSEINNGNPPFYGLYLAILWKIFGKTLFISHMGIIPFMIGYYWQFLLLAKRFLPNSYLPFAALLFFFEPTTISVFLLMGNDIILNFLFLLGFNAILSKQNRKYLIIACVFSVLISIRGLFSVSALFIIHTIINKRIHLLSYLPALFVVMFWYIFHYLENSWVFFAPESIQHRQLTEVSNILNNFLIIIWRLIDNGRIIIWLYISYYFIKIKKHRFLFAIYTDKLILAIFSFLIFIGAIQIIFTNPILHRYYMPIYILIIIIGLNKLFKHDIPYKRLIIAVSCVILFSGNFVIYPYKYSNAWDSNLKFLSFNKVYSKMNNYVRKIELDRNKIGTRFPLAASDKHTYLNDIDVAYGNIADSDFDNYEYILFSNVSNSFTKNEINNLQRNYQIIHKEESGFISIQLFKKNEVY